VAAITASVMHGPTGPDWDYRFPLCIAQVRRCLVLVDHSHASTWWMLHPGGIDEYGRHSQHDHRMTSMSDRKIAAFEAIHPQRTPRHCRTPTHSSVSISITRSLALCMQKPHRSRTRSMLQAGWFQRSTAPCAPSVITQKIERLSARGSGAHQACDTPRWKIVYSSELTDADQSTHHSAVAPFDV
jgi:hypothetical protein